MTAEPTLTHKLLGFTQRYAIAIALVAMMIALTSLSEAFLTTRNLLNILNQNAPLMIMAAAMTYVIVGGGFDLSAGAIFGVGAVTCATLALAIHPLVGLLAAPLVGAALGAINGVIITTFKIHSFLATLATGMVFRGIAIMISGGTLVAVRDPAFTWLGREQIAGVNIAIFVMAVFATCLTVILSASTLGRRIYAVGGNAEAATLSGIRVARVQIATFAFSGLAAGLAAAITVSRISMGQPSAGEGFALQAIAAVILGGTSIYGGEGAVWRSLGGVLLLALINNGFNILNADPFLKDLTTGIVILVAVAVSVSGRRS